MFSHTEASCPSRTLLKMSTQQLAPFILLRRVLPGTETQTVVVFSVLVSVNPAKRFKLPVLKALQRSYDSCCLNKSRLSAWGLSLSLSLSQNNLSEIRNHACLDEFTNFRRFSELRVESASFHTRLCCHRNILSGHSLRTHRGKCPDNTRV